MKFIVRDGQTKDCIIKEVKGQKFWVTPNKGHMVAEAGADDVPVNLRVGCSLHTEPLPKPTAETLKDDIKAYMDENKIAYNSGDTKDDLLVKIEAHE